jgi:uncharacterized membrane protein
MATMERPAWTVCFGFQWLMIAVATIIMHVSLIQVIPAVQDFPDNLVEGFMVVFKFNQLRTLAEDVKTDSESALALCDVVPATVGTRPAACASPTSALSTQVCNRQVDISTQRDGVSGSLGSGLSMIQTVGNDPYLGTPDMNAASTQITSIQNEVDGLQSTVECCAAVPAFCAIWDSGDELYNMYQTVQAEIDTFTTGEAIEQFNEYAGYMRYLHALPWVLTLSTVFFAIMWIKNGACCCCTNGSFLQCLCLALPQSIFWFLAFIIMAIFAAIGYAWQFVVLDQTVSDFNGEPTVGQLLDHFQTAFPEFWDLVFKDLSEGLALFRIAATIFVIACLIIAIYSCCFCCRRPYETESNKQDSE